MKAIVIVAHPDDETIWSGGFILQNREWDWTVFSLCRSDDPDRAPKFEAVCRRLGAVGLISDLDDSNPLKPINASEEIGCRILDAVGDVSWDLCLTHGENGEYGHLRHQQVHTEVLRLVKEAELRCGRLWTFAYDCDASTAACTPAASSDVHVQLTDSDLSEKKRIMYEVYRYGQESFEVKACISPEAFRRVKDVSKEVAS